MPFSPRKDFITPFADEAMRLLREDWSGEHGTKMLSEELFAILQQGIPRPSGPITITLQTGLQDFIKFRNQFGDDVAAIDFRGNLVKKTKAEPRAAPLIIWSDPADISSGTALSGTQLNAVATDLISGYPIDGTYEYTPASGTVLSAGSAQALNVVFTPSNSVSYKRARKTAHINVTASGFGYIQAKSSREATGSGTGNRTIAFNSNVAAGSVVFAVFRAASAGTGLSISDSLGNTWNAVTGDNYARYCITNGAGAMTITFNNTDTPAAPGNLWTAGIIEYSGPPTAVPFDSQHDTPFPPDMAPTTTSPVLVSGTNNLMIGVVTSNIDSPTMFAFTPQAGFATRISETTEAGNGDSYMFVWDKLSVSVNTVISGTLDNNSSWSCYGFSFKLV